MRIERIVVGVDFSAHSMAAVEWVALNFPSAALVLVHCIAVPRVPGLVERHEESRRRLMALARASAAERLALLVRALAGRTVWADVREGAAVEALVTAVGDHDADLVVVATTGSHGAPAASVVGHTAERLARCSPVPVLLCTGAQRARPARILVAVDDADITPSVLAWTRHLAARFDARVAAVHVVSSAVLSHVLSIAAAQDGAEGAAPERAREAFRRETDGWISGMVTGSLDARRATSEVDFGEPGREIVAAALRHDSDLVVLGSHGAGGVPRVLLGSVVSEVLHHAPCPVLVVVDPAPAGVPGYG